jgi:transposase-like protein
LRDLCGIEVSPDLISAVTDAVLEEVSPWQARPLEAVYPLIFFDALRVKIRDEGLVRNKAVHIALGVRADDPRKSSASGSSRNGRLRVMVGKPRTEDIFSSFRPITDL